MRVKKNDTVLVLSGKDKGKQGVVIEFSEKKGKIKIGGIAQVTKHLKARKQGQNSAIIKTESFIDISNVMLMCVACKQPTRIGSGQVDNAKVRVCKRCNETVK